MAPIAEADVCLESTKGSLECPVASRTALADLGSSPNGSSTSYGSSSTKKVHDAEAQREWDKVALNIRTYGVSQGIETPLKSQAAVNETNGSAPESYPEKIRGPSSFGLGIKVDENREDTEEENSFSSVEAVHTSSPRLRKPEQEKVLPLSQSQTQDLIPSPDSITVPKVPSNVDKEGAVTAVMPSHTLSSDENITKARYKAEFLRSISGSFYQKRGSKGTNHLEDPPSFLISAKDGPMTTPIGQRSDTSRMVTSPAAFLRRNSVSDDQRLPSNLTVRSKHNEAPSHVDIPEHKVFAEDPNPSPMPPSIPLPPLSIPTYLELELSSQPPPGYIYRSVSSQYTYESSRVKIERLLNFLLLPPALEQVLWFGALACLDSWLYTFTILPLRFIKALYILMSSWAINISRETQFISTFIIKGIGRMWRRQFKGLTNAHSDSAHNSQHRSASGSKILTAANGNVDPSSQSRQNGGKQRKASVQPKHRRQKSIPSTLSEHDKADILKGFLILCTCLVLNSFDASRMYHWIRGQNAIKLYVIYNVLEVGDRLLSAIGQDVLECLFSSEALSRRDDGRSKVARPFWLFMLALAYTTSHATALFYQVVTLNVAVNSYSNALITLLLSNQFVEIKSTVFKKFEKENLFQLTCADVVERFQLWLMLTIIASRNIVETGAFTSWFTVGSGVKDHVGTSVTNSTPLTTSPRSSTSILPQSFTFLPSTIFTSLTGGANSLMAQFAQVLGPFLIVLGSEMFVDWLKHAYINKFNNTRPSIYGRFLDVLAKDYYTNAFADQNLTKRLGLAVIPMACLFFRVSVQTYQMFLQALLPMQASSTEYSASLTAMHEHYSNLPQPSPPPMPLTVQTVVSSSIERLSWIFNTIVENAIPSPIQSVTFFTIVLVLTGYLILLISKLTLGILLLSYSRSRYKAMKEREQELIFGRRRGSSLSQNTKQSQQQQQQQQPPPPSEPRHAHSSRDYTVEGARRVGGWGVVEVDEDKRRWIYADDPNGLRKLKERDLKEKSSSAKDSGLMLGLDGVNRYDMVAKRIW